MILEIRYEPRSNGKRPFKRIVIAQCDDCGKKFTITHCAKFRMNEEFQFCNQTCVKNSLASGKLRDKTRTTSQERFGTDNPFQNKDVQERFKQTLVQRYGVTSISQIPGVTEKQTKTRKNSGKPMFVQLAYERSNSHQANFKRKQTLRERYGVENSLLTQHAQESRKNPDKSKKSHETMKKNGTYRKSRYEDLMYEKLLCYFNTIERQKVVNKKWAIDFYIPANNVYVQFDGDYWHGLDRPLEIIKEFRTSRDRVIYKKWLTDREQDEWFLANNLKLVRIKQSEFSIVDEIIANRILTLNVHTSSL